jgi:hypothetical protein
VHLLVGVDEVCMRFKDIEVSGITTIVFNRKYAFAQSMIDRSWIQVNKNDTIFIGSTGKENRISHEEMMSRVNHAKKDKRFRMWVHNDTLNITRKDEDV